MFEPRIPEWPEIERELEEVDLRSLWSEHEYRSFVEYLLTALASAPAGARPMISAHWEKSRSFGPEAPIPHRRCWLLLVDGDVFVVPLELRDPQTARARARPGLRARTTVEPRAHVQAKLVTADVEDTLSAAGWRRVEFGKSAVIHVYDEQETPMFRDVRR